MPDTETFFQKLTSINFTVKNLSPNRKIHIFNYPLMPGETRDLLAFPEISEADIRHSLIKGELANFIRMGVISIVSSSIDLAQYDSQQQTFLTNAGISPIQEIGSIIFGSPHGINAPIFDGINTFSFASLTGSTYSLVQDIDFSDGAVINSGVSLYTAGYRLFCNGTLTNNGTIYNDGYSASGVTAGLHSAVGTLGTGEAGGAGHTGIGNGTGVAPVSSTNTLQDANPSGGAGGAGGASTGGAGGVYLPNTSNGGSHYLVTLQTGFLYTQQAAGTGASLGIVAGGGGGGGGGSDGASCNGGGGGGGGGVIIMCILNLVNNGVIRANGGNGASATGTGGNAGSGGGGGGGIINIINRYYSGSGSISVSGGLGGTVVVGSGVLGSSGNPGHINHFYA